MLIRDREVSGLDVQNGVFNFMMWLWVTRETNKKKKEGKKSSIKCGLEQWACSLCQTVSLSQKWFPSRADVELVCTGMAILVLKVLKALCAGC